MLSTRNFAKGTQVIATIDIITSVLSFTSIFLVVYLTIAHGDRLEVKVARDQEVHPELAALFALGRGPFVMVMLIFMFICLCYFYLARYLLYAANERSFCKIHRWCTLTLVIIILRAAFFITAVYFTADRAFVSSFGVVGFLYQIFCLWFVRTFEDRLRTEGEGVNKMKILNEMNLNSFPEPLYNQHHLYSNINNHNMSASLNYRFSDPLDSLRNTNGFEKLGCSLSHEDERRLTLN